MELHHPLSYGRDQTTSPTLVGVEASLCVKDQALETMNRSLLSPGIC